MARKLKPDRSIAGLVPAIISLVYFALISAVFGVLAGLDALGVLMIVYAFAISLWSYIKTSNAYNLVGFVYLVVFGVFLTIFEPDMLRSRGGWLSNQAMVILILVYVFWFWLAYLVFRKKLKWRGREVMELAAMDVEDGDDSYTDRPRPAGKISATQADIIDFALYLKKNVVFMSHIEDYRVILVPVKMGREFSQLYKSGYDPINETWIAIDFDGSVTVHISRKDYLDYLDNLSFDKLSESLGTLVIRFYNQFSKHEEVRILDQINAVKVGHFS